MAPDRSGRGAGRIDQDTVEALGGAGPFHGVGDDYIRTSVADFTGIVEYLAREKARIWTGTFYEVASYVHANPAPASSAPRND